MRGIGSVSYYMTYIAETTVVIILDFVVCIVFYCLYYTPYIILLDNICGSLMWFYVHTDGIASIKHNNSNYVQPGCEERDVISMTTNPAYAAVKSVCKSDELYIEIPMATNPAYEEIELKTTNTKQCHY